LTRCGPSAIRIFYPDFKRSEMPSVPERAGSGFRPDILEEYMANHKSAVKRHRQSLVRAARNRAARTRVKSVVKEVRAGIRNGDRETALRLLSNAASVLDKSAGKGAIHRKKAARKISRMHRAVNAMTA
jgi:small subunit ribosomal protein S20